ncbi:MAG: hypothetical protein ACOVQ4_04930 [Flectobacillus sp.]|uniref:hypothetical protein n=1 Tax=Flectobacillus sp. TaxID=50419 RepID=UPI003B9CDD80
MKNYFIKTFLLAIFFLINKTISIAQHRVNLKNGSQIVGKLLKSDVSSVSIQTIDQSVWVFTAAEIVRIDTLGQNFGKATYKRKGFVNYTELGPLAMSNRASNGVTTSAFSFQTTNGYRFNSLLYLGIGVGADLYAVQTFVPVVLSVRGDLSTTSAKIPFYFVEGGYSINATSNDVPTIKYQGGATFAVGLGIKLLFQENNGFLLGLGYRYQESAVTEKLQKSTEVFNRLSIRVGFSF